MVIRKARSSKVAARRNLPIIVITGRTDSDTYKMAARRGIQGYLMKPISPDLLIQTLNDVLAKRGHVAPKPEKSLVGSLHSLGIKGPTDVAPPPSLGDDASF
jgi:DNA-binding NarL/FixJ family response regulator